MYLHNYKPMIMSTRLSFINPHPINTAVWMSRTPRRKLVVASIRLGSGHECIHKWFSVNEYGTKKSTMYEKREPIHTSLLI